jgi:mono/diheme cytochrome c family protein
MIAPVLAAVGGSGAVPVIILIVALVGFGIAYFVVGPGQRKGPKRNADIPLAMRPYHADEELETTGMERAMAWGVALAVFSSLFLALYWLIEPTRINNAVDEFYASDVEHGREEYQNACAACHGVNLEGGSAPHPDPDVEAPWPAPALDNIVARYQDSEVVEDVHQHIMLTLIYGRDGTPMQAFGVQEGGSYSDNQLEQITAYILSVQTGEIPEAQEFVGASGDDVFDNNCARCHGAEAEGWVGPQLQNVFERYGWSGEDDETLGSARTAVEHAVRVGRYVPGEAPMPSFDQELTDDAIDAVIDHLEGLQETGGPRVGQIGGPPRTGDEDEPADDGETAEQDDTDEEEGET